MLGGQPTRLVVVVEEEEEKEGVGEEAEEGCCHVEELSMEGERDVVHVFLVNSASHCLHLI